MALFKIHKLPLQLIIHIIAATWIVTFPFFRVDFNFAVTQKSEFELKCIFWDF